MPRPPPDDAVPAYERLAAVYDRWLSTDIAAPACLRFYRQALRDTKGRVLELGVGTGRITAALLDDGVDAVGLDGSRSMVSAAPTRVRERAVLARFESLPFRPGVFDVVICPMRTIGHVLEDGARARLFDDVHGSLRPGGRFLFDHYNLDSSWATEHDGVPILVYAGRDAEARDAAVLIWTRYDYDFDRQRLRCTVRVERVGIGGSLLGLETTEFDFGWSRAEQYEAAARAAGFRVEACFGDYDGAPFEPGSAHIVFVVRRPEEPSSP